MAIHHIIPRHEWRARFGNLKGFNVKDNRVTLTTEQHAQVHLHYFNEITKIKYDFVAGMAISGQIGREEAIKRAGLIANVGKTRDAKWKQNHSKFMKGRKYALGCIYPRTSCPHCKKVGGSNIMVRWHFDNCKEAR